MSALTRQLAINLTRWQAAAEAAGNDPKRWCRCRALLSESMARALVATGQCDDDRPWEPFCSSCGKPQRAPKTIVFAPKGDDWEEDGDDEELEVEESLEAASNNGHRQVKESEPAKEDGDRWAGPDDDLWVL